MIDFRSGATGPDPATTVTGPDAFGAPAAVGTGTKYAREDHDHGLPAAPTVPSAATSVTGPDAYGAAAVVGTSLAYARQDHDHGLPAASGGSFVLLEEHTAASSTALVFTSITSSYDDYQMELLNVLPATSGAHLVMQLSTNGGSTWLTTGYAWANNGLNLSTGGALGVSANPDSWFRLAASTTNATGNGISGTLRLPQPLSASVKQLLWDTLMLNTGDMDYYRFSGGGFMSVGAINAVRLLFDSGNIAGGTVRLYGLTY